MTAAENLTWWSPETKHPHERLQPLIEELWTRDATLRINGQRLMAIYQFGFKSGEQATPDMEPELNTERNAFNAAKNAIQTKAAKLCKSRIIPMALTTGGNSFAKRQAQLVSKGVEGEMDANNWEEIKEQVVMDAEVTAHGAGAFIVYSTRGKKRRVKVDHVPIEELVFDHTETRYRKPPCLYRRTRMDRYRVCALVSGTGNGLVGTYAERREAIMNAIRSTREGEGKRDQGGENQIDVYEAWHLSPEDTDEPDNDQPPAESGRDLDEAAEYQGGEFAGRHVICINGATLVDEPWDRTTFPIGLCVLQKRFRGMWGLSDMNDLASTQREYEDVTADIQTAHNRLAMSGWMVPSSCNLKELEFANARGLYLGFDGQQPPMPFTVPAVDQATYAYQDSLPRNMMLNKGISTLSATSQLPAGLAQSSGIALQTFEDVESERMMFEHREIERMHVRLAWLIMDESRAIAAANDNGYRSRYEGRKGLEAIDWKEIDLDRETVSFKVFAVSALSKTPSARYAQIQDMFKTGALTLDEYKRLMDIPDLEAENDIDNADIKVVDHMLDLVYFKGKAIMPEGFSNLQAFAARAAKYYNLRQLDDDANPDRLQMLRDLIAETKELIDQAAADAAAKAPPTAPMPTPGAPPPGGMPGAPPMNGAPPMAA